MDKVRFLIIRFSSIGDIVLTTPVVRNLKAQVQNAEIHYLTKKQFAPLLENNPHIDFVHAFDGNYEAIESALKNVEFDYIIDLHKNLRSSRITRALGRVSFKFNKLNVKKWLYVNLKINKMPNVHIVDRYLDTLHLFDVQNDNKGLDYYFAPNAEQVELPEDFSNGYVAVVIGANHATKQIPENIAASIINKSKIPTILIGGKAEAEAGARITAQCEIPTLNLCGKTTLDGSAYIIKNSRVVLTPDTGMMHIAAAMNKKIISVWGNTTPDLGMYPYMPQCPTNFYIAQVENLKCRPCSKIGFEKCPKKHFNCMNNQNIDKIVDYIKQYFSENDQ